MKNAPEFAIDQEIAALRQRLNALEAARATLQNTEVQTSNPRPGTRFQDGSVFCGISPNTGRRLFAMPDDEPGWDDWNSANARAAKENSGLHKDWRLPSREELALLYENRASIGGFIDDWYHSGTSHSTEFVWFKSFSNGTELYNNKSFKNRMRFVRTE